jgi:cytochrome c5
VSAKNDAAFLRMFMMVLGALVAFTVIILFLANRITGVVEEERGEDPRVRESVLERIEPVGSVNVAAPAAAAAELKSGAEIVASACNACHVAGVLGAPKVGDKDAWLQRLSAAGGLDGLTASAIAGKGGMPPKGGANVSDAEIRAAVEHLLNESGVTAGAGDAASAVSSAGPVEAAKEAASDAAEAAKELASSAVAAVSGAVAAVTSDAADEPAADLAKGKSVYDVACVACHMTGAAGAPKLGDKAAWGPRVAQGMDSLVHNAINGKNAMPPKGGRTDLSDQDIVSAVAYLVEQSR